MAMITPILLTCYRKPPGLLHMTKWVLKMWVDDFDRHGLALF